MPARLVRSVIMKPLARCVALTLALCALLSPANAQNRDVVLRFMPPESPEVMGYMVYVTDLETEFEAPLDAGFVPPDLDGIARTTVVLDAARSYRIGMSAYNEGGESSRSNEIVVAAETPVCEAALCDDGNTCTSDHCGASDCVNTNLPDGTLCDDGYADTLDDQCVQGACEGVPLACRDDLDCDDGNVCNGFEACSGGEACLEGVPLDCGEATACQVPRCDSTAGCVTDTEPDGTLCDDGLVDTRDDACQAGVCQGVPTDREPGLLVEGLSPNTVSPGRHTIRVDGQGFVLGAVLTFENGEGRAPRVMSMLWVDAHTLEASIEVSRKGPKRPRSFDARLTLPDGSSTTLPDALRIEK